MINSLIQKFKLRKFKSYWRKTNSHNFTYPISIFPIEKVKIGNFTYGNIDIRYFGNKEEKLIIGNFVSIANEVVFILGGNHQINTLTTYPLYSKLIEINPELDATTKGAIHISDDVWIGTRAMILSGVTIGKGAIIGAGAIVTKDIPPYAIVGGNPAKIIRYRFDNDTIKKLNDFDLSKIELNFILKNISDFYDKIK